LGPLGLSNIPWLSIAQKRRPPNPKKYAVMHKAQVRLEDGESSIEIEIGIEIDSVQFYASV
jgi:hypothetical protein